MNYLVIKCGGSVLEQLPHTFYSDMISLQKSGEWNPVIVHGGGPLINSLLEKLDIPTQFVDGLRVTTAEMLDVIEMVLSGTVNKRIVRDIHGAGGKAIGISGVDGNLITACPTIDSARLGFVGDVESVQHHIIEQLSLQGWIPVISPIGIDVEGQRYNINGDIAASAIASSLGAKLCFVSDIPGIRVGKGNDSEVLASATKEELESMIEAGQITGGMIPKVRAAIDGLVHDVPEVVIINGMVEGSLLDYLDGKAVGTKLIAKEYINYG